MSGSSDPRVILVAGRYGQLTLANGSRGSVTSILNSGLTLPSSKRVLCTLSRKVVYASLSSAVRCSWIARSGSCNGEHHAWVGTLAELGYGSHYGVN
jgi:hypothetical protein